MLNKKTDIILSVIAFLIAITVYIITLPPTVWFIDSGELASVAITLGIAHPTGYPLFTLIGHLFTWIPINTEIYRNNLLSGVFCAVGVFMMYYLMKYLLNFYSPLPVKTEIKQQKKTQGQIKHTPDENKLPNIISGTIILFTCIILAFSKTYWFVVRLGKVYPIHVFLMITMMMIFLKAIFNLKSGEKGKSTKANKYFLIFAYLLGLSFSNHMTTILLTPAWLTLFLVDNYKDLKGALKILCVMAIFFIIAFSVYLYLPIRASQSPTFIWGNPVTFEKFIWHITGKQFQVWIFSGSGSLTIFFLLLILLITGSIIGLTRYQKINPFYPFGFFLGIALFTFFLLSGSNEIVSKQFKHFFDSLWTEFGTGVILLSIPGIYRLSRYNGQIFYFTLLTFFGCVFYSVNYDIHDIDSYFLLAYITLSIWIGFGALFIYELIARQITTHGSQIAFSIVVLFIAAACLKVNYSENDSSKDYSVEDYTMNIFKNAEPNSIILSSQWDFWLASSWYYHFVKNIRPDLIVIDKELLRRSWYFKFIQQNFPEVYNNSKPEIERFLSELYKFEHNIPYDQPYIVKLFEDMLTSFVTKNPDRIVYTTWEIEQNKNEFFATDFGRIPDGLLFRLVKNVNRDIKTQIESKNYKVYDFKFTPTTENDYYHKTLMQTYAAMLTASAQVLLFEYKRNDDANKYLGLALSAIGNFQRAVELKRKLQQ